MSQYANLKEVKVLRKNEHQKITLTVDSNNKKYIKREIYSDKRDIYKTLQKINHPNIPRIFAVEFDDSTVVTEEYIEGNTLGRLMDENVPLSNHLINSIAKQLASAMEALHNARIIHRDIKPDNIMINSSGHIWVIDYNISRFFRNELRQDTEVMGTFGYAPIEQFGMIPTDYKSDIYSFGVTITELLNYAGKKGALYKIADKCKKLDPAQRYKNTKNLRNAIRFRFIRSPLLYAALLVLITAGFIGAWQYNITEEQTFFGFEEYPEYTEYKDYPTFAQSLIFSTDEPQEHLLFIDDLNMQGKIKLGEKNTLVNADITLNNGELSVSLADKYGSTFDYKFKYKNQYIYNQYYSGNLRKNADIICRDLDYDSVPELLIGLNEGLMGVTNDQFYNPFNYCIGWCVKYDESSGFTLCEGDMFSKGQAFTLTRYTNQITVPWEDIGDITGYELKDDALIPFY